MTEDQDQQTEHVTVLPRGAVQAPPAVARTVAQQRRDDILSDVEAHLRASRDALSYALENMKIVMVPQHLDIEKLIGQLIEQVIEERSRWR